MNKVLSGHKCGYCNESTEYIDSVEIYGRSYGMVYMCRKCDAWVGVHKGTDKALGRVANAELRELKKEAHHYFDAMWKAAQERETNPKKKKGKRGKAYAWLSEQMGTPIALTHIGMFDNYQCKKVIEICKPYYKLTQS